MSQIKNKLNETENWGNTFKKNMASANGILTEISIKLQADKIHHECEKILNLNNKILNDMVADINKEITFIKIWVWAVVTGLLTEACILVYILYLFRRWITV
ncbi:MAG: hypothetical protein FWH53_00320 [Leptospirales bacterium]|nr:hypothetical protein [Leptospirales bacterium]